VTEDPELELQTNKPWLNSREWLLGLTKRSKESNPQVRRQALNLSLLPRELRNEK